MLIMKIAYKIRDNRDREKQKKKRHKNTNYEGGRNPGVRFWNKRSKIRKKIELQKGSS